DNPHWLLVFTLVLTQAAAGMFLAGTLAQMNHLGAALYPLNNTAFAILCIGLAASVLHLGQPLKAWRAFLGWRSSWLSREIIALNLFAAVAATLILSSWLASRQTVLNGATAGFGILGVFTSAMVYVDTRRPSWSPRFAFSNFFGTTLLLAAALT